MNFLKKFLFISFIFLLQLKSAYAEILLGNWILSNPVVSGKTSTWSAITKDSSFKSDVSISPSSIQVANHLSKNSLSELAINAVTQAIPDGTDFIIDSSSQQLKYNLKADNHNTSQYKYTSPFEYGDVYTLTQAQESLRRDLNEYPGQGNYFITGCVDFEYKYECYFGHKGEESDPKARSVYFSQTTNDTYDSNAKPQTTSLVNVATKVINLADQNNSSAVSYIAYVVKDLIQYDTNYRQSLETQLNSKLKGTPPNNDDEEDYSAYEIAKNGGKDSGFYKNNVDRPTKELEKGIRSLQKQIDNHRQLIRDPERAMREQGKGEWSKLDPRQQEALLKKKWPSDIQRQIQQRQILRGILKARGQL